MSFEFNPRDEEPIDREEYERFEKEREVEQLRELERIVRKLVSEGLGNHIPCSPLGYELRLWIEKNPARI